MRNVRVAGTQNRATRLLSVCPRLQKESGCIVATTSWRVCLLLLGMLYRRVVVDPKKRRVTIESRYLWFIKRRRSIPFSKVTAVTYGYEDLNPNSVLAYSAYNSCDLFTVGLQLNGYTQLHLFNFLGDGTFTNSGPLPDWVYWPDRVFDVSGSQERESRVFVDVLSKLIGVTVVPPRRY